MAERTRLREAHIHDHFGTLFGLLVAAFLVSGFSEFHWARISGTFLQLLMLLAAYFATRNKGTFPIVVVLFAGGFAALAVTTAIDETKNTAHGLIAFYAAALYLAVLIAVFRRVVAQRQVNTETILGALCVYFILGLMFSSLYTGIDTFSVEPIFGYVVPRGDYSYFSFVTLTTVGYGDITAVTDIARRLAVIEAMAGQIFLVTVVARLVSLYGVEMRKEADADEQAAADVDADAGATTATDAEPS